MNYRTILVRANVKNNKATPLIAGMEPRALPKDLGMRIREECKGCGVRQAALHIPSYFAFGEASGRLKTCQ